MTSSSPAQHDQGTGRDAGVGVLRAVWAAQGQTADDAADDCGPQKTCKNMAGISFDGWAEPGSDLGSAWRDRLEREGKLNGSGQSLRDLVLGTSDRADG
jgi:hypothetical protein